MILLLVVQESNLDGATTTIDSEGLWGLRIIASVATEIRSVEVTWSENSVKIEAKNGADYEKVFSKSYSTSLLCKKHEEEPIIKLITWKIALLYNILVQDNQFSQNIMPPFGEYHCYQIFFLFLFFFFYKRTMRVMTEWQ